MPVFKILATVQGGVTGFRQALVKHAGRDVEYATREQAEIAAQDLTRENNSKFAVAMFSYTVIEG